MTDEKQTPEVTKPRRLRCLIAGSLLGLWMLAIAALGFGVLSILYGWQPERLRAGLESGLGDVLGREIRIGRLEGGLLSGLTLYDVSIAQPAPISTSSGASKINSNASARFNETRTRKHPNDIHQYDNA